MIELVNINKYYKSGSESFHALKNINLKFGDHGMHFILGKSGSGKSTLLNIIGGIDSYDSGQLFIDNTDTASFTKGNLNTYRNTYIGFVFQEFNVLKGLSVYDNIALSLELQHINVKNEKERIDKIIEQVGLTGLETRMMNQISGGQRQRVAIARSLVKNPRVIIADEPTGNLDSKNSEIVMDILKELSKNHLIIVVTHNDKLAHKYGDRIIEIKDGEIVNQSNDDVMDDNQLALAPIKAPLKTSLKLAVKSIFRNVIRFIIMILLFSLSLTFAGIVINLSLVNTTKVYSEYQRDYGNFVINISRDYSARKISTSSAFNYYDINKLQEDYNSETGYLISMKGMDYYIPINQNNTDNKSEDIYVNTIQRIHAYDQEIMAPYTQIFPLLTEAGNTKYPREDYTATITDYLADALIYYGYFGTEVTKRSDIIGKKINYELFKNEITITSIIKTNYLELLGYQNDNQPNYNTLFSFENLTTDNDQIAAFKDNIVFYSSLFVRSYPSDILEMSGTYEKLYSLNNMNIFYDDVIFDMIDKIGTGSKVRYVSYLEANSLNKAEIGSRTPVKPNEGKDYEIAVSTGFFEKVLQVDLKDEDYLDSEGNTISKSQAYFNKIYYNVTLVNADGSRYTSSEFTKCYINGVSRIPTPLTCIIVNVVENEEPVIYTPTDDDLLNRLLSSSFGEGGFLTFVNTASNQDINAIDTNSKTYDEMIKNDVIINNIAFQKILLVNNFIDENLWLFIGIFFVFGLFSVLLIFNFVIINIKNSTRDIGIYMSLGLSGFRISLIYLFQVLIMGIISFIIGVIFVIIFLFVLDSSFTRMSSVDLNVISTSFLGILSVLGIAVIVPTFAVVIPLYNLSRKHPVDVIKTA